MIGSCDQPAPGDDLRTQRRAFISARGRVPGGTAHTFWNPRLDPARYVLVMGARTFALIQAIHATNDRGPERMRQLYAAHGATLLG